MSATARKDVLLVVRAKNEAERALNGAAAALQKLFDAQADVASGATITADKMRDLVAASTAISKASGIAEAAADKGAAGFERQQAALVATKVQYASVAQQITNSAKAIEAAQRKIVEASLTGGDVGGARQQLGAATGAQSGLIAQQERLRASVAAQESAIGKSASSLQQLGSIANAVDAQLISVQDTITRAQREALAATERETAALRQQAVERQRLFSARSPQNAIDQNAGVSRTGSVEIQQMAAAYREEAAAAEIAASAIAKEAAAAIESGRAASFRARSLQDAIDQQTGVSRTGGAESQQLAAFYAEQEKLAAAADRLRSQIDPVAAIQSRLNTELAEAQGLYKAGAISATELANAQKVLATTAAQAEAALERTGKGVNGKLGLFGLKPYELTNLGYQVNDVFTQLASGTGIMQVLAQQGGQIIQLMPNVGASIIAGLSNPYILAAAAAMGLFALATNRAANEAERLRGFEGRLAAMGEGATYSAKGLSDTAHSLDLIGLSAEEAVTVVRRFVTEGVNPERIDDFGRAARNMAKVMGIDVVDAAGQVATAFTGGLDAITRLQDATRFMTQAEFEHVQSLFAQGRAVDANREAFNLFYARMEDGKNQMNGPWSSATRSLSEAWDNLMGSLSNTAPIQGTIRLMSELADIMDRLAAAASGDRNQATIENEIEHFVDYAANQSRRLSQNDLGGMTRDWFRRDIAAAEAKVAELRIELQRLQSGTNNPEARTDTADSQAAHTRRVEQEIELNERVANARTTAARAAAEGERAYRQEIERTGNAAAAEARRAEARRRVIREAAEREESRRQRRPRSEAELTQFGSPTTTGPNGSAFGWRIDPITGRRTFHGGRDLPRAAGTPVYATADGRVTHSGPRGGYGNLVELNHGQRTETRYGHLQISLVTEGQEVKKGDLIGRVGSTGRSTGNHLHYEVRRNGRPVDPNSSGGRFPTDSARTEESELRSVAQRQQAQEQFNQALDFEIERRQQSFEQARQLQGLAGDALFAVERQQVIEDAMFQAERQAAQQGLEFTDDRRAALEEIVGLEWDIANARERATAAVNDGAGERSALLARREEAVANGETGALAELDQQIAQVETRMKEAIDTAIRYWESIGDTAEARTAIAGLRSLQNDINRAPAERERGESADQLGRLQERRGELQQQIEFYQNIGQTNVAEQIRGQLVAVDQQLLVTIDNLIAFWQASNSPEAENTILQLQNMRNEIVSTQQQFQITAGQLQEAFAGSLVSSVEGWVNAIAEGGNVLRSTRDLFLGFASDFLKQIASMLFQALALKLAMKIGFGGPASGLSSLLNAAPMVAAATGLAAAGSVLTVGGTLLTSSAVAWAATAAAIMIAAQTLLVANALGGGGVFHDGGIAGSANVTRSFHPAWFAGARRMHTGGIVGLAPDEVPTILQRGEEVLARDDPRHMFNGGGSGGGSAPPPANVRIINQFDTADMLAGALDSAPGERSMLNFVRRNSGAIKQALDS